MPYRYPSSIAKIKSSVDERKKNLDAVYRHMELHPEYKVKQRLYTSSDRWKARRRELHALHREAQKMMLIEY